MALPEHNGPFQVGAIDLEIPAREPRSFATDIVTPDRINKPAKKSKQNKGDKIPSDDAVRSDRAGGGGKEQDWQAWSPFLHGSQTSTLHFSTVLMTIFYPTSLKREDLQRDYLPVAWLGRPKRKGAKALVDYLGQYGIGGPFAAVPVSPAIATLLAAKTRVYCGPPLADPHSKQARAPPPYDRIATGLFGNSPAQFPLVIFSHGLAGNRLAYSQLCGELASQGVVVAAIEHRDGSGISSIVRPPAENESDHEIKEKWRKGHKSHPKAAVPYFDFSAIGLRSFATDPNEDEVGLRQAQLAMRCAEIDECLHVLKRIADGDGAALVNESTRTLTTKLGGRSARKVGGAESLAADPMTLKSWEGKLDIDYPALMGHSFGGATAMEYLRGEDPSFPFGIILDTWVEPIIIQDDSPRPLRAPVYVINSESFTVWDEHFQKLKRIVADAQRANREHRGWVITLSGSEHLSFSDYPLLLPRIFRSTVTPSRCIEMYSRAALVQMGLLRQRYRERANKPGFKRGDSDDQRSQEGKDETLGVRRPSRPAKAEHRSSKGKARREEGSETQLVPEERRSVSTGIESADLGDSDHQEQHRSVFVGREQKHARDEVTRAIDEHQDPLTANGEQCRRVPSESGGNENENDTHSSLSKVLSNSSTKYPQADDGLYRLRLEQTNSPASSSDAKEQEKHMSKLTSAKEQAAEMLWSRKGRELPQSNEQEEASTSTPPPRGVKMFRTPSGGMTSKPRGSTDEEDFTTDPTQLEDQNRRKLDADVEIVHAALRDISESQKHKKNKLRSVIGLLYLSYGMKPGIGAPGSVLIHDLTKGQEEQIEPEQPSAAELSGRPGEEARTTVVAES